MDSDRVCPLSLYTGRTDIPKYTRHEGPDDRVYGNVIEGSEARDNNRNEARENNAAANNDRNDNLQENSNQVRNQSSSNDQNEEDKEDDEDNGVPVNLPTEPRNNNSISKNYD